MAQTQSVETLIIGAGPIGLELAVACKRAGLAYHQIDAAQVGQTISWYPESARFFSSPDRIAIAGVPLYTLDQSKATKEEYIRYLYGIVTEYDLAIDTYTRAEKIVRTGDGFRIDLADTLTGARHTLGARRVVCAIGDMHRARRLDIPGEDLPFVSHYFRTPRPYFRRRLLIVGGRNSAVEAALRCHHAGARVTVSYRGAAFPEESIKYWLLPEIRSLCAAGAIEFHPHTTPVAIEPGRVRLRGGSEFAVETDFVLLLTGYEMDATLLEEAGVRLVGETRVPHFNEDTMETNVPGLYVAGTATAGTQKRHKVFIENSHVHVERIVAAISGQAAPERKTHRAELET